MIGYFCLLEKKKEEEEEEERKNKGMNSTDL